MKAGVIFTGTGPILILTSFESFSNPDFARTMARKGIKKYFACEVDLGLCRTRYGEGYEAVSSDVGDENDLRILDYNGHNVFNLFSFNELGQAQFVETPE